MTKAKKLADAVQSVLEARADLRKRIIDAAPEEYRDGVESRLCGYGIQSLIEKEEINADLGDFINFADSETVDILTFDADVFNKLKKKFGNAPLEKLSPILDSRELGLAKKARKASLSFDDIKRVSDEGIQLILREIDALDIAMALKIADNATKEKIFSNMSKRAAAMLKEDMEFMGPVKTDDVEDAQEKILALMLSLLSENKISLK